MWECEWWGHCKTDFSVNNHVKTKFPYKRPLSTNSLLVKIKNRSLFGYVQCDLIATDELKPTFSNFPPIFKNIDVCRNDIGEYMKIYAEGNVLDFNVLKFISTHLENVSSTLFNLLLMLDENETIIHILELLLRR